MDVFTSNLAQPTRSEKSLAGKSNPLSAGHSRPRVCQDAPRTSSSVYSNWRAAATGVPSGLKVTVSPAVSISVPVRLFKTGMREALLPSGKTALAISWVDGKLNFSQDSKTPVMPGPICSALEFPDRYFNSRRFSRNLIPRSVLPGITTYISSLDSRVQEVGGNFENQRPAPDKGSFRNHLTSRVLKLVIWVITCWFFERGVFHHPFCPLKVSNQNGIPAKLNTAYKKNRALSHPGFSHLW